MRTKNQQGTDKAIKHNGCKLFSRALVFRKHQQKWCQLCFIIYPLFVLLPHHLRQLPFSPLPPPPPPPEHATVIIGQVYVLPVIVFPPLHPSADIAPVERPFTDTSRRYRVGRNFQRRQNNPLTSAVGPSPRSPPPLPPPLLFLPPLLPPPYTPTQSTLCPHPHCFSHSPIHPPQN